MQDDFEQFPPIEGTPVPLIHHIIFCLFLVLVFGLILAATGKFS